MDVGKKIHDMRIAKGMTLEELGQKVGVGKSTVRKWETGAIANMRRDKIEKLAHALGCDPLELLNDFSSQIEKERTDRMYVQHAKNVLERGTSLHNPSPVDTGSSPVGFNRIRFEITEAEEELLNIFHLVPEDEQAMILDMIRVVLKNKGLLK